MEWLREQFEFWPKKITPQELNEELEKAAKQGRILSPKESAEKAKQVVEKLEEKERGEEEDKKK